jgi:hypothetical protein
MLNPDFRDILSAFSDAGVEYLLVGAYAMASHGYVRATGDIDLWVRPGPDNAQRVFEALRRFGAPLRGVSESDFAQPNIVLQLGVPPRRIDVLTAIDGVAFEEAWSDRVELTVGGLRIPVLSREHLIQNKEATGRAKDQADAEALRRSGGTRDT